jgi:hypothetical protein
MVGKEFLFELLMIKKNTSTFNYNNEIVSTKFAKTTKLSFKNKISKNNNIISDKNIPIRKVLPSLIRYLDNIVNKKKKETFDKLKDEINKNKFCDLLKKFKEKTIKPMKEEYINKIKREAKYAESRPIYQVKLFKLLRKIYIKKIVTQLVEPSSLYNLFYLINLTKMHKYIAEQRFNRELIRKWRFITFTKKLARKKLELMYKNLHASYLQMADEIFGEENNINPSVFKEFERFGSNVGMFTGQEPQVDEELNKKYYTNVEKKYIFNNKSNVTMPKTRTIYIKEESKEITEEEKEEYINARNSLNKNIENVNKKFDGLKKGRYEGKYFTKK